MRVGFTSCYDQLNDGEQPGWTDLLRQRPDVVVLLGDNIYMDYGFGPHLELGEPRELPLAEFSRLMHERYSMQWQVPAFRAAIAAQPVHAIWDDHDFAWNNARGGAPAGGDDFVRPDQRRLSRALFEQFRDALRQRPQVYPPNPHPSGVVAVDLGGVQQTIDLLPSQLRLHLLDGRSFREPIGQDASLLGADQRDRLAQAWLPEPGINLVASGTTLSDWSKYGADFRWLHEAAAARRLLVLSGDIHKFDFRGDRGRLFEATASALAQPPKLTWLAGRRTEVFGLLDIADDRITVGLWRHGKERERYTIARADWRLLQ